MDFIANQKPQIAEMLRSLGMNTLEELFADIPKELLLAPPPRDDGLSEFEGIEALKAIAAKNSFLHADNYLGAGAYEHYVPALVGFICQKSEFLTAYTPYQAEASQGLLQVIFEFQSVICALTGMEVANASMYDGASACAEALLMGLRHHKGKSKLLIAGSLHPHYRAVIDQYLECQQVAIKTIPFDNAGLLDREFLEKELDDETAAVLVQYPNFFGLLEEIEPLAAKAARHGALMIVCGNPLAYGLFKSPAELGADIAVGDCQPLGLPLQFGGPYAGYLACKEKLLRQMPGRIVGETTDTQGRRGFVLTFQAREQHIRREKATSNICTNQALAALASLVHILWYGKKGLQELALTNYRRAAYLKKSLEAIPGIEPFSNGPHFNEFLLKLPMPAETFCARLREEGIEAGIGMGRFFPDWNCRLLVAVTETKNKNQLDKYISASKRAVEDASRCCL